MTIYLRSSLTPDIKQGQIDPASKTAVNSLGIHRGAGVVSEFPNKNISVSDASAWLPRDWPPSFFPLLRPLWMSPAQRGALSTQVRRGTQMASSLLFPQLPQVGRAAGKPCSRFLFLGQWHARLQHLRDGSIECRSGGRSLGLIFTWRTKQNTMNSLSTV